MKIMMQSMRRNMKTIMLVVAASFVVGFVYLQLGQGGPRRGGQRDRERGIIGRVNGRPVTAEYFRYRVNLGYEELLARRDVRHLPEEEVTRLQEEVWQNIIEETILDDAVARRGITVTDRELVGAIRSNPPPALLNNEAFRLEDGTFDIAKYNQLLTSPQALPWLRQYEAELREILPRQKLMVDLMSSVVVSDAEVRQTYWEEHEQYDFSYLRVDPRELKGLPPEPTPEEVEQTYAEEKEMFHRTALARLKFVKLNREPSEADWMAAREEIEAIREELEDGADFTQMARERSDDLTTGQQGGDLGFLERSQLSSAFEQIVFSLSVGKISEPIRTPSGWRLIEVQKKTRDAVKARQILIRARPSWETLSAIEETARTFWLDARELGFEEAAEAHGLTVSLTDEFPRGVAPPGLEPSIKNLANDFGFEHEIGEISPIFAGESAYYICQVERKSPEYVPPLEEIVIQIEGLVRGKKKLEMARVIADSIAVELAQGRSLEAAAAKRDLEVHETGLFSPVTYQYGIPPHSEFQGAAYTLKRGEVRGPVPTRIGYFLIRCNEHIPMDEEAFGTERAALKVRILQDKQRQYFDAWLQRQLDAADIDDNRRVIEVG
jgi:peptidyl-prolyl cis-trans isomerase D